jgi:hypothetical protein
MDLTNIYRIIHITVAENTFISVAHRNFSKIAHILGHKASLNKHRKFEILSYILADYNVIN